MIAIVDYDMGNVASVANMLKRIGIDAVLTRDPEILARAEKIILPGVGAFDKGMGQLRRYDLIAPLEDAVHGRNVPVLGICLGMHLLTNGSEEGTEQGLGWIDGKTVRFRFPEDSPLKIPHMGWNYVTPTRKSALFSSEERSRFYFVHGYYVACERSDDVVATSHHGAEFTCAVNRGKVYGVQFHPEKSHRFGMRLLESFVRV